MSGSYHGSLRERLLPNNISTAATTLVKTGMGFLGHIIVNGGTAGAITVYDGVDATGTKIATIAAPAAGMVFPYGSVFKIGLCIVTAAATDITVCYV